MYQAPENKLTEDNTMHALTIYSHFMDSKFLFKYWRFTLSLFEVEILWGVCVCVCVCVGNGPIRNYFINI